MSKAGKFPRLQAWSGLQTFWPWPAPLSPLELHVIIRGLPGAQTPGDSASLAQEQKCFWFRAQDPHSPSPSSFLLSLSLFFPFPSLLSPSSSPFSLLSAPRLSFISLLAVAWMTLPGLPRCRGKEDVPMRFRASPLSSSSC